MRAKWLSVLVLGLAFGASACGSDDPVETETNPGGGGDDAKPACVVTPEMEEAALADYESDGETDTPGGWAATCGRACLPDVGTDAYSPCVSECIMGKTNNALSPECATCLVIPVECAVLHCFSSCAADTPECDPCLCAIGEEQTVSCIDEYTACSGLTSDTCEGL
jgi:hypothetical protein